jgi:hypothetical protein
MCWKTASLALICLLGACGVQAENAPTKPQKASTRYEDKQWLYSFQPPAGWKPVPSKDLPKPMVGFSGPNENGFAVNCVVNFHTVAVKAGQEEKFVESVKEEYKKYGTLSELKRFRHQGNIAFGWRTVLSGTNKGLENRQVVFFFERRAYELTLTLPTANRKKYDPVFEKIVASFRFGK